MYANGTGVTGYIPSPADTLADYNIMLAKADQEAMNNPWANATLIGGNILANAVGSGALNGIGNKPTAANGSSNASGTVNAEKGEIIQTPEGAVGEVGGQKHEQGGTDISIPPGTQIFSDRIMKDGKTMADRKSARETKRLNLQKLLEKGSDVAINNTVNRKMSILDKEEEGDLAIQDMFDTFHSMHNQFAYGTGPGGIFNLNLLPDAPVAEEIPTFLNGFSDVATPQIEGITPQTNDPAFAAKEGQQITNTTIPDAYVLNPTAATNLPTVKTLNGKKSDVYMPTAGDITGLIGDAISTFGPIKNTLENRATDTPNINAYKDFGKDAIAANEAAQTYVAGQKDNAIRRISDNARTSKRALRNTARGVNTMRATDLNIDVNADNAELTANDAFAKQMMELFSQKSGLENTQDTYVMAGEAEKDMNNRKDKDNFYTQKAQDTATMGTGVQTMGKDINTILKNPMYLKLLNEMGKYFSVDAKGNLIAKTTE